jgi:hypothetical protein
MTRFGITMIAGAAALMLIAGCATQQEPAGAKDEPTAVVEPPAEPAAKPEAAMPEAAKPAATTPEAAETSTP